VQTHAATLQAQRSNDLAATLLSLDRKSDKSVASTTPKILLGYSMGARAALLHAITNPTHWDALILISANPGIESAAERSARAASDTGLAQRIIRDGVPAFLEFWQQTPIIRSQQHIRADWRASMQQYRLQHTAAGLATNVEQFGQAACPNLWPQLNKLQCPILLISGEHDLKYCTIAERIQRALPQAQWIKIPDAGHMPHLEAPEATATAIRRFVHQL
tara:strand:+ start:1428 stop:2084 length:657 start_codon:yes stop_codon:yes gene_type:complete